MRKKKKTYYVAYCESCDAMSFFLEESVRFVSETAASAACLNCEQVLLPDRRDCVFEKESPEKGKAY